MSAPSDSECDDIDGASSPAYANAIAEHNKLEKCKVKPYRPTFHAGEFRVLRGEGPRNISIGRLEDVDALGASLPSGRNLTNYIVDDGGFDMISFFEDHSKVFPKARVLALKEVSGGNVEVDCERFFSIAGFVSHPTRATSLLSTHQRLAMLAVLLNIVYVDEEKVVQEFMRRQKGNDWDENESREDASFLLLEKELAGEDYQSDDEEDDDGAVQ